MEAGFAGDSQFVDFDNPSQRASVVGWPAQKTFKHPPALVHVVESGETLYSITRRYETSVAEIILANLSNEPIRLYSGTKLVIPNPGSGFAGHGLIPLDATLEDKRLATGSPHTKKLL